MNAKARVGRDSPSRAPAWRALRAHVGAGTHPGRATAQASPPSHSTGLATGWLATGRSGQVSTGRFLPWRS